MKLALLIACAGCASGGSIAVVAPTAARTSVARTIRMGNRDVSDIQCRIRASCVLVFPSDEMISFASGGSVAATGVQGKWVMEPGSKTKPSNIFSLKPASFGTTAETTLNIATLPDHSYAFRLHSCDKCDNIDTKVFIEHVDPAPAVVPEDPHVGIIADNVRAIADLNQKVDAAQEETTKAREDAESARKNAQASIDSFQKQYPLSMRNDYKYKRNKQPFSVQSIWHDDIRTYVQISGELSSIYTFRDNKPEIVQFSYARAADGRGTYVIDRVLTGGYLSLGKKSKLEFEKIK